MAAASWIADWWAWCVATTLQGTVLLGLAWLADRVLVRRVWPQVLTLLWLIALARFFLPPQLGSPLSVTTAVGERALAASKFVPNASTLSVAFSVWLAGAATVVVVRCIRRARIAGRIERVDVGVEWKRALERATHTVSLSRTPRLGTLPQLRTAAVVGLFRPTLLVPRDWLDRRPGRRDEHALLHELAHLVRRDLWLDELCALTRAALWFHPLVWIALERLHALSELQCDQAVARALGRESSSYRDTLILAARPLVASAAPRGVRAFIGHPSAIVLRIELLERAATRSALLVRGVSASLAFALAACVLPMAPRSADLREQARAVFAAERRGEIQSCFVMQAAAMVLADDSTHPPTPTADMKPLILVALLSIAAAASAMVLQEQKPQRFTHATTKDADGGGARWMASTKPGPAHERLKELIGSYDITMRMSMGAGQAPMESKGTSDITWYTEGKWLQENRSIPMMGMPSKGLSILGYDNFKERYVLTQVDSIQTCIFNAFGHFDQSGDNLILWGTIDGPGTPEQDKQVKRVYRGFGKDKFVLEVHDMMIGETDTKVFEIEYVRRK